AELAEGGSAHQAPAEDGPVLEEEADVVALLALAPAEALGPLEPPGPEAPVAGRAMGEPEEPHPEPVRPRAPRLGRPPAADRIGGVREAVRRIGGGPGDPLEQAALGVGGARVGQHARAAGATSASGESPPRTSGS